MIVGCVIAWYDALKRIGWNRNTPITSLEGRLSAYPFVRDAANRPKKYPSEKYLSDGRGSYETLLKDDARRWL